MKKGDCKEGVYVALTAAAGQGDAGLGPLYALGKLLSRGVHVHMCSSSSDLSLFTLHLGSVSEILIPVYLCVSMCSVSLCVLCVFMCSMCSSVSNILNKILALTY